MRQRLFEFALLEQRDADVAVRVGVVRVERDGAAAGGDRLVDFTGEALHFTDIGMIDGDAGVDRDGAVQVFDCLRQLT
jgi:hypothetical protein